MIKKLLTMLAFGLWPVASLAQVPWPAIDYTTPYTNNVSFPGSWTFPGLATNVGGVVESNNVYLGDTLSAALQKHDAGLSWLYNAILNIYAQGVGTNGGVSGLSNIIVTNYLTLQMAQVNRNSQYILPVQVNVTNLATPLNGKYVMDYNVLDATFGCLTNSANVKLVMAVSSLTTNGWQLTGEGLTFNSFNYNNVTNVGYWQTNQVLSNLKFIVGGAGHSSDNGTYTNTSAFGGMNNVPAGYFEPLRNNQPIQFEAFTPSSSYFGGIFGSLTPSMATSATTYYSSPANWEYFMIASEVSDATASIDYFMPWMVAYVCIRIPGLALPMGVAPAGFYGGSSGANSIYPAPTLAITYSLTNGPPVEFIEWNIGENVNGISIVTNVYSNIVYSSTFDWFIATNTSGDSYTIQAYDPNGAWSWLADPNSLATVCPNVSSPPYPYPQGTLPGSVPSYFAVEAGANWATVIEDMYNNLITNETCSCCPPVGATMYIPGTNGYNGGNDVITNVTFTTNYYQTVLGADPDNRLQMNYSHELATRDEVQAAQNAAQQFTLTCLNNNGYVTNLYNGIAFYNPIPTNNLAFNIYALTNGQPSTFGWIGLSNAVSNTPELIAILVSNGVVYYKNIVP